MEEKKPDKPTFTLNERTFKIALYIVMIVAMSAVAIRFAFDWSNITSVFSYLGKIFSPFIAGAFIAFLISPIVYFFQKNLCIRLLKIKNNKVSMTISIILTYIIIIGLFVLLLIYVIPQIISSIIDLTGQINSLYIKTMAILNTVSETEPDSYFIDYDKIINKLNDAVPQIINYLSSFTSSAVPFLYSVASSFLKSIYNAIVAFIFSIYIIGDHERLLFNCKKLIYALLPVKGRDVAIDIIKQTIKIFSDFVLGKAIDSVIIGLLNYILMTILGLKFAVLISVIVGITNMIPYFGPFIGAAMGALILLITNPIKALVFLILILILQQLDGIIIGPKILGDSIGIKPLWVIFGITVGGSLGKLLGMFLGVPLVAVLAYILDKFISYKLSKKDIIFNNGTAYINVPKEVKDNDSQSIDI